MNSAGREVSSSPAEFLCCSLSAIYICGHSNAAVLRGFVLGFATVFVVAAPPHTGGFIAALGRAVEPLIHAPKGVQSARKSGISVVNDAVLERERAHARSLANVRGHISSGHGRVIGDRIPLHAVRHPTVV